jgi:hypothetical protein
MAARREKAVADGRPYNNLLRRLSASDFALLEPHLVFGESPAGSLLYNPGDDVDTVHFPCGPSLASFMVPNEDGRDVETILVGREGAVGGIVSEGYLPAYTRITVKFGGPFVHLQVRKLDAAKTKSATLRNVFARPDLSSNGQQRDPLDRAAHREMDHFGHGADRGRRHRAVDA